MIAAVPEMTFYFRVRYLEYSTSSNG